jgi:hypothetical protein
MMNEITENGEHGVGVGATRFKHLNPAIAICIALSLVAVFAVGVNFGVQTASAAAAFSTAPANCIDGTNPSAQGGMCGGSQKYVNQEGFAFEVTTTKAKQTVRIPVGGDYAAYDWDITWGDNALNPQNIAGTGKTGNTIAHIYQKAGKYAVRIQPHGTFYYGWFNAFGNFRVYENNEYALEPYITKILTPFSGISRTAEYGFNGVFRNIANVTNLPSNLFYSIDTSKVTDFSSCFEYAFQAYAQNSTTATIPATLFSKVNTSKGTNFSRMFAGTFYNYGQKSKSATIPTGLFGS